MAFFRLLLIAVCLHAPLVWSQHQDLPGLIQRSLELLQTGQSIEAETVARQAIALAENWRPSSLPVAQQRLGVALRLQGRFAEAESILRSALIGADRYFGYSSPLAIKTQIPLGLAIMAQGRYAEADRQLREAMERAPDPGNEQELDAWLDARVRLGYLQIMIGNYAEAENLLLTVWHRSVGSSNVQVRRWRQQAAESLALLHLRQGHHVEAEPYAQAAAEQALPAWGARHSATQSAYTNLGLTLLKLNKLDQAEIWLQRAIDIADALAGQDIGMSSKPLRVMAQLQALKNQPKSAEALFERALAKSAQRASSEVLLSTLHTYARFLQRQGKPEAALPLYERALALADRLFALSRGLEAGARENKLALLRPIYAEAVHNRVQLDNKYPGQGHDRAALANLSRIQSRLFTEMLRTSEVARSSGDDAFIKLKAQRDTVLVKLDDLNRRFYLIARLDANAPNTPNDNTLQPAQPIHDPFILQRWRKQAESLRREQIQLETERDATEKRLWREYPRYMELEEPQPTTVEDLQRNLRNNNESLLAYFRLQHELLIFRISHNDFELLRVPVERDQLDNLIKQARLPMEGSSAPEALARLDPGVLHQLYTLLLQPVQNALPANSRVLVVGDGPLYTLPMAMLVTRWTESEKHAFSANSKPDLSQYNQLDYAGAHWRFSYLPSLATLGIQRSRAKQPTETRFRLNLLAFADPVFAHAEHPPTPATRALLEALGALRGGQISIPRLPETADEVSEVAHILGGKHLLYLRESAQERRVKTSDLMQTRYLHFATHGLLGGEFARLKDYIDDLDATSINQSTNPGSGNSARNFSVDDDDQDTHLQAPLKGQPALVLTLVGDLAGEDGLLTMSEVMSLKMNADLVVLSACNTAGEGIAARNGEGFAGLTRAFMHAGARGLLVSHWNVESLATSELITGFFRRHKGGADKAGANTPDALAEAQADLRASYDLRLPMSRAHPFFWAPFVHVGD